MLLFSYNTLFTLLISVILPSTLANFAPPDDSIQCDNPAEQQGAIVDDCRAAMLNVPTVGELKTSQTQAVWTTGTIMRLLGDVRLERRLLIGFKQMGRARYRSGTGGHPD